MSQDLFLLTEPEIDRLRGLFESCHYALFEFIESRRVKSPAGDWDEPAGPEMQNFNDLFNEVSQLSQQEFDF